MNWLGLNFGRSLEFFKELDKNNFCSCSGCALPDNFKTHAPSRDQRQKCLYDQNGMIAIPIESNYRGKMHTIVPGGRFSGICWGCDGTGLPKGLDDLTEGSVSTGRGVGAAVAFFEKRLGGGGGRDNGEVRARLDCCDSQFEDCWEVHCCDGHRCSGFRFCF